MRVREGPFPLGWVAANAVGMALGFLVFLEVLFLLAFGLDSDSHWSTTAVEDLENAGRLLPMGLAIGLPLAGAVLTCCQAVVLGRQLPSVLPWILAGSAGFAVMILLVWPLSHLGIWGHIPGPVEPSESSAEDCSRRRSCSVESCAVRVPTRRDGYGSGSPASRWEWALPWRPTSC